MQGCSVTTCGDGGAVVSTFIQGCSVTTCNRRPQTPSEHSDAQTRSDTLRCTPTPSDALTWSSVSLRAVTVYVVERIEGSTLRPPTWGERGIACRGEHLHAGLLRGRVHIEAAHRLCAPDEVIRGHQRSSEVIRGHQRPSEVIRGHQRSSEAITDAVPQMPR